MHLHATLLTASLDGIMVARGDLGVEMNPWDVPLIQKRIVETCKIFGKPVVIATQMMESMIESPTPTRAEASDCANAIFDASDAIMLSAESAAGKFPVESVTMQQLIINKVETDESYSNSLDKYAQDTSLRNSKDASTTAITMAARTVSDISKSKAILAFTASGGTVLRVSKLRPKVPILAIWYAVSHTTPRLPPLTCGTSYNWETARQLAIVWGVYPIVIPLPKNIFSFRKELSIACEYVCAKGYADAEKDLLTVTAGLPFGVPGTLTLTLTLTHMHSYSHAFLLSIDCSSVSRHHKRVQSGVGRWSRLLVRRVGLGNHEGVHPKVRKVRSARRVHDV